MAKNSRGPNDLVRRQTTGTGRAADVLLERAVAQRNEAEQALEQSEMRFRSSFTFAPIGMAIVSLEGKWLQVNRAICEIVGYDEKDLLQITFQDITHPADLAADLGHVNNLLSGSVRSYQMEKRYFHKDGHVVWVQLSVSLVTHVDGRPLYFIAQIQDITERKSREQELLRFRAAMDSTLDAVSLIDRTSMTFIDVNVAACRMLGYSREELLRMGPQDIVPIPRRDLERLYDEIITGDGTTDWTQTTHRRRDGTHIPVEISRRAIRSGDSWVMVGVARDISARLAAVNALKESESRFRDLTELSSDWYWEQDHNYRFTSIAGISRDHLEHRRELALGKARWEVGSLEPAEGDWNQHKATLQRRELFRDFIIKYQTKTDEIGYMSVSGKAYFDAGGQFKGYRGTGKDITAQKRAEDVMRQRAVQQGLIASFWQQALESVNLDELLASAVAIICQGLSVEFCNVLQLAGDGRSLIFKAGSGWQDEWVDHSIAGTPLLDQETQNPYILEWPSSLAPDTFQSQARIRQTEIFQIHGIRSGLDMTIYGLDAPYGLLGAYSSAKRRFGEDDVNFLKSLANILGTAVERKKSEEKLAYLAQFDPLTGLPNRSLFRDRLAQTLTIAERNGWLVGVMFADLDRFKNVNDTLGHDIGDKLLVQAAERLSSCIRTGDTVARLGGDEFALILFNVARADDCSFVAQKLVAELVPPFELNGQQVFISASLGIAVYPADGNEPEILLKNADTAMYRAKELGRNGYQFYLPDMNTRAVERLAMEVALRGALERNEFLLHYQPKVNVASGQISGFEALLRWQHHERGLVPPAEFISILEDTGLIVSVGEWVIRSACEQLKNWKNQGARPCSIAVNLSARQFRHVNLDSVVGKILQETDVNPHLLEFELTESLLMSDADQAVQTLRNLKAYGVRLSVDDFGTGYSSLAYLKRFPLDALKIDRTFISNVTTDAGDATIALAIINLAHSLKLTVVAEGVETKAQLDFLRAHVCDEMQGYYFARPMSAEDSTKALVENRVLSGDTHKDS